MHQSALFTDFVASRLAHIVPHKSSGIKHLSALHCESDAAFGPTGAHKIQNVMRNRAQALKPAASRSLIQMQMWMATLSGNRETRPLAVVSVYKPGSHPVHRVMPV